MTSRTVRTGEPMPTGFREGWKERAKRLASKSVWATGGEERVGTAVSPLVACSVSVMSWGCVQCTPGHPAGLRETSLEHRDVMEGPEEVMAAR